MNVYCILKCQSLPPAAALCLLEPEQGHVSAPSPRWLSPPSAPEQENNKSVIIVHHSARRTVQPGLRLDFKIMRIKEKIFTCSPRSNKKKLKRFKDTIYDCNYIPIDKI